MQHNVPELLNQASVLLCKALEELLSQICHDGWWSKCVVGKLSFQQRQQIERRGISRLDQLDLAALLRILDQNWFELADLRKWPYEGRNFVKEMQTVRNRWAHAQVTTPPVDDIYRDLDTLQRFLELICPEPELATIVASAKMSLFTPPAAKLPIPEHLLETHKLLLGYRNRAIAHKDKTSNSISDAVNHVKIHVSNGNTCLAPIIHAPSAKEKAEFPELAATVLARINSDMKVCYEECIKPLNLSDGVYRLDPTKEDWIVPTEATPGLFEITQGTDPTDCKLNS